MDSRIDQSHRYNYVDHAPGINTQAVESINNQLKKIKDIMGFIRISVIFFEIIVLSSVIGFLMYFFID